MKKMLIHLPLAAVLLLGIAAPATAANTNRTTNPNGMDRSSFGTDVRDGMNNMDRYNQFNNGNGIGNDNRIGENVDRSLNRAFNTDGNYDNNRNGTYRARAADNNNTNWSWLGLLGLIGLAGMFRGSDNRSRT